MGSKNPACKVAKLLRKQLQGYRRWARMVMAAAHQTLGRQAPDADHRSQESLECMQQATFSSLQGARKLCQTA